MLEQLTSFCLIASLKSSLNCFSYYFSDSCSLSFLLFSPSAPIDVTSTWPQGLIDLSQFMSPVGMTSRQPATSLFIPPQIWSQSIGYLKWGVSPPVWDIMMPAHLLDQLMTSFLLQPQGINQQPLVATILIIIWKLSIPHKVSGSMMHSFFPRLFLFAYLCDSLLWTLLLLFILCHYGLFLLTLPLCLMINSYFAYPFFQKPIKVQIPPDYMKVS